MTGKRKYHITILVANQLFVMFVLTLILQPGTAALAIIASGLIAVPGAFYWANTKGDHNDLKRDKS